MKNSTSRFKFYSATISVILFSVLYGSLAFGQTGACCLPDNRCSQMDSTRCINQGGAFLGRNQLCEGNANCTRTNGVCCINGKCISGVSHAFCMRTVGNNPVNRWINATSCTPNPCPQPGSTPPNTIIPNLNAMYYEEQNHVEISWEMLDKSDRSNFYIERSSDGKRFKTIGYWDVNDNPNTSGRYTFVDINPYTIGYYRLLQLKDDGSLALSQEVTAVSVQSSKLIVRPNPSNANNIRILLKNMQFFTTQVSIFDLSGRLAISRTLRNGENSVNISALSKGTYVIKAIHGKETVTSKFIKN